MSPITLEKISLSSKSYIQAQKGSISLSELYETPVRLNEQQKYRLELFWPHGAPLLSELQKTLSPKSFSEPLLNTSEPRQALKN